MTEMRYNAAMANGRIAMAVIAGSAGIYLLAYAGFWAMGHHGTSQASSEQAAVPVAEDAASIRLGISQSQVQNLLGPPGKILHNAADDPNGIYGWEYSLSGGHGPCHGPGQKRP